MIIMIIFSQIFFLKLVHKYFSCSRWDYEVGSIFSFRIKISFVIYANFAHQPVVVICKNQLILRRIGLTGCKDHGGPACLFFLTLTTDLIHKKGRQILNYHAPYNEIEQQLCL